ncbi:MAG: ATP-binding protein [Pseudohongiellaceae bacterium]|nr:ATP-binding protein [Pseudohongiellaceae bacterium]
MTEIASSAQNVRILLIYNIYRLSLALVLGLSFYFSPSNSPLGSYHPDIFVQTVSMYCLFALAVLFILKPDKTFTHRQRLLSALLALDILAIALVSYSSGGAVSGFSLLHLVTISAGGILIKGRMSTLLAAIATIATLSTESYLSITYEDAAKQYVQSGLLGALLFATSIYLQLLAERIRKSADLTEKQASSIYNLEQLNQLIIQRMRTGILVVHPNGEIITLNDAAAKMLGLGQDKPLNQQRLPPQVSDYLRSWINNTRSSLPPIALQKSAPKIQINFAYLSTNSDSDILIFLEDTTQFVQRAQQMKLASLGRLTASIAHEIRNPLGAISHASQLLQESENLDKSDGRLLDIVLDHCDRVNLIIEDVLQMSKQQQRNAERFNLNDWVKQFVQLYCDTHKLEGQIAIETDFPSSNIDVKFIPSQLEQVIRNLIENGLRYSLKQTGSAHLILEGRIASEDYGERPVLNIIDDGEGIDADAQEHLFEPFYTTEKSGTGLGLYISKELCEANQAQLSYGRTSDGKSCFSIYFSHPDKNIH